MMGRNENGERHRILWFQRWVHHSAPYTQMVRQSQRRRSAHVLVPQIGLERKVKKLCSSLDVHHLFNYLSGLYALSIDEFTEDPRKSDRILEVTPNSSSHTHKRNPSLRNRLDGNTAKQKLLDSLGELLEPESLEVILPKCQRDVHLNFGGFQRLLASCFIKEYRSARYSAEAVGTTASRLRSAKNRQTRDYAPSQQLWQAPPQLFDLLRCLHVAYMYETYGQSWRAKYHLNHISDTVNGVYNHEFARQLIGDTRAARDQLFKSLRVLLPINDVREILDPESIPFTFRGFEQAVINGMREYLGSFNSVGTVLGIGGNVANKILHDTHSEVMEELPYLASLLSFRAMLSAYALRGEERKAPAVAKQLSVNMYQLQRRAEKGKELLQEMDCSFPEWIRGVIPKDHPFLREIASGTCTQDLAQAAYLVAVCERVGNISLASEVLQYSPSALSVQYHNAKGKMKRCSAR